MGLAMNTHRVVVVVVLVAYVIASIGGYLFLGPGHGGELPLDFRRLPLILGGLFVALFVGLSTVAVRRVPSGLGSRVAVYVVSAGLAAVGTYVLAEVGVYDWIDRRMTDTRPPGPSLGKLVARCRPKPGRARRHLAKHGVSAWHTRRSGEAIAMQPRPTHARVCL